MKVFFIVILYKTSKEQVLRLKTQIKSLALKNYKLVFIDNTKINRGYAGAINKGIKLSKNYKPDFYVIANDDISIAKLDKQKIFDASKFFDIWGFSLKQNKEMRYGGVLDKLRLSGGLISRKPKKRFKSVDFVSGSLMIIKREVINDVGLFDESYFLYYEEVDYCARARLHGFKIGIDSKLVYEHYEVTDRNDLKEFYLKRNRIKYLLKYGTIKQKVYEIIRIPKTVFEDKNSLIFNFLSLNISSLINRAINFVLFLILLRTLTIENYGVYTLVWAHINIFSPIADFGTTAYGIVKLPLELKGKYDYFYSLRIATSTIAVLLTILLAFILKLNFFIVGLIILTSPIIISNAISGSYLIILTLKNKQYLSSVVSVIFNLILLIVSGFVLLITKSLLFLFISISFLYIAYAIVNFVLAKKEYSSFIYKFNFKIWNSIAKKSLIYVLISLLAGLYFKLDLYLLNFLKNTQAVGIYSAGYKFFEAFIFIAGSYSLASLPTLTKLHSSSKAVFISKIKKDFILLGLLGYFIALTGYKLAPYIMPIIFKGSYMNSIEVFKIVIFSLPVMFATTVFLNGLYILKKAYLVLAIFVFQVLFNLILNLIFIPKYSYFAASYITLISEVLTIIISATLFIKYFKHENRN